MDNAIFLSFVFLPQALNVGVFSVIEHYYRGLHLRIHRACRQGGGGGLPGRAEKACRGQGGGGGDYEG